MNLLTTIENQEVVQFADGRFQFLGDMDIDGDGVGGNASGDTTFQNQTSLRFNGKSLDAGKVAFVVAPIPVIKKAKGIVLGCKVLVVDLVTGNCQPGVCGDAGPPDKLGEVSIEMAKRMKVNPDPKRGGSSDKTRYLYLFFPGVPGVVDGVTYKLQAYG